MKNFTKVIKIGQQPEFGSRGQPVLSTVYCKIEFKDGKLSISGVVGLFTNGNCAGSCGQIYDSIEIRDFSAGWDKNTLTKFLDIWREYHLNDMCAYTPEMKAAGWDKLASKEIYKYSFILTNEYSQKRKQLQEMAISNAINSETFRLLNEDKRLLKSDTWKEIYAYEQPQPPQFMEAWTDYESKQPKIERKTLGWVDVKEHADGLLGRELNGKKYGHEWYKHEIPADVIEWLAALPESDTKPAWI